jgi:Ca2+-binding RTX toxin-like protein
VTTGGATGVVADGKVYYPTWPTGRILIFGGSASYSVIEVSPLVTTPTYIFGGPGNYDSLAAGGGPTVIVGGGGSHDTLTSLSGRDVLIAGTGSATLDAAGTSQDMLVGGTTAFNSNQAILNAVLTEWNSSATYAVRVAAELAAYGSQIHSSGVADILYGNVSSTSPGNWFLRSSLDSDYLVKSSETVTPIV